MFLLYIRKGYKEILGSDGNVYFFDCGDGNMSVFMCLNLLIVYSKYV